jgi:xanthine dehydrogenase YagT iron-sulfur-binding subunit
MSKEEHNQGLSRRHFIKGLGGGLVGTAAVGSAMAGARAEGTGPHGSTVRGPDKIEINMTVNSRNVKVKVEPRVTLLDALRDHLGHTGAKRVCNRGQCGACTIIMNGRTVLACSLLALDAEGARIETVEGLAEGDQLHPLQDAFVKHDAFQCGFCTSGFIMSCVSLLKENPSPGMEEIKHGVSGNLCRCGSYPNIFKAVGETAKNMKKGG